VRWQKQKWALDYCDSGLTLESQDDGSRYPNLSYKLEMTWVLN